MNFLRTLGVAALIGAPLFADSIPLNTSGFGILAGDAFTTSGSLTVDGNIGTPTSGDYSQSGTVKVDSPFTNFTDTAPGSAESDFLAALSTTEAFTPTVAAPESGAPVSATFTLAGANTVFSLANTSFTGSSTLTFNDSSDPGGQFIIEASSLAFSGLPTFDLNGVSPADILWVVTGNVSLSGNGTFDGTILSGGNISVSGDSTYDGSLFAKDDFDHSGGNTVIDPAAAPVSAVPEPSAFGSLSGFIALGVVARKFRTR
jgi:hypothetical protein